MTPRYATQVNPTHIDQQGFSLLEVMVAVAILALSLTAIFSSQVGAFKTATRARRTTIASLLARCKMGEIEEKVLREGLPAIDASDNDECCEDSTYEGFRCEWQIKRVVLPDITQTPEDEEGDEGEEGASRSPNGIDALQQVGSPEDLLSQGAGDGLADMAIEFAYPVLKPSIEEQVRRAEVKVLWKEGNREHHLDVVQYLVAEQNAAPPPTTGTEGDDSSAP